MEAATTKPNPVDGLRRFLGTRRGSLTVAAIAAALAAGALAMYLSNYKKDVRAGTLPTQVLIADRLIPKGTSGDAVAADRLFRPTTISADDVKPQALTDAATLTGKSATRDIFPGQQITAAEFESGGDAIRGRLSGTQRAIAIPVDTAHGLIGNLRASDRVDVFGSFTGGTAGSGILMTIAQNVLVLKTPRNESTNSNTQKSVILRLTDSQSARLAYTADNGKVWVTLRPPAGGESNRPVAVTLATVGGSGLSKAARP